ncbi:hypothetical protein FRB90_006551 [Tulasnella sp. 427]|nr:hypothetical protein FRB90_006551 [Tulasnella sp. 427]
MHLDIPNEEGLQSWLVKTLEPICDADPNTLAEYIIAVLKNEITDVPDMKALHAYMDEQLKEFIQETSKFTSLLLSTVRSKSYISGSGPAGPSSLSVPSSHHATRPNSPGQPPSRPRSRKRSLESADEQDADVARRSTRQKMEVDQDVSTAAPSSYQIETFDQTGHGSRRMNMMGGYGQRPPGPNGNGPVKICYDFFNKGHCRRGDACKYSHGPNPIVGSNMPFLPNGMMNPAAFMMMDPTVAMSFLMGSGMANMNGNSGGMHRSNLDRDADMVDMTPDQQPRLIVAGSDDQGNDAMVGVEMDGAPPGASGRGGPSGPTPNGVIKNGVPSYGGDGEGAGRRKGGLPKHAGVTTIVVDKIPPTNLSEQSVTEWFQRFGTISKVLLDRRGKQALLTFSDHKEANAAIRSQDAPWGNKFAKVFWHNPIYGGAAGAKVIANDPTTFDKTHAAKPASSVVFNASSKPTTSGALSTTTSAESSAAIRRSKLEEQKKLLEEASTATSERKKEIIVKLRELDQELSKPISAQPPPATVAPSSSSSITPTDPAATETDRLDKELDIHSEANALETSEDNANSSSNRNYEALKAQLASLRAEALSKGTVIPRAGPVTVAWQVDNVAPGSLTTGPVAGGSLENLDEDTEMPNPTSESNVALGGGDRKEPGDSGPDNYHVAENYDAGDDPDAAWWSTTDKSLPVPAAFKAIDHPLALISTDHYSRFERKADQCLNVNAVANAANFANCM